MYLPKLFDKVTTFFSNSKAEPLHPIIRLFQFLQPEANLSGSVTILDVGANIGQSLKSLLLLNDSYLLTYHAFELVPENSSRLRNAFLPYKQLNYNIYDFGLSNKEACIRLYLAPEHTWHSINNNEAWKKRGGMHIEARLCAFDDLDIASSLDGVVLVKIDVEGHELQVLEGMKSSLQTGKIHGIVLESGFNVEDKQHTFFPDICNFLTQFGFRCVDIVDISRDRHPIWNNNLSIGFCNAIFLLDREKWNISPLG